MAIGQRVDMDLKTAGLRANRKHIRFSDTNTPPSRSFPQDGGLMNKLDPVHWRCRMPDPQKQGRAEANDLQKGTKAERVGEF